jgi:hypothetical protein
MTWSMTDSYSGAVDLRFFDTTANLVWPDATNAYYITHGQTIAYPLACSPGHQVCYGGADDATQTLAWGAGIDGTMSCTNCCGTCNGQTYAINLTP